MIVPSFESCRSIWFFDPHFIFFFESQEPFLLFANHTKKCTGTPQKLHDHFWSQIFWRLGFRFAKRCIRVRVVWWRRTSSLIHVMFVPANTVRKILCHIFVLFFLGNHKSIQVGVACRAHLLMCQQEQQDRGKTAASTNQAAATATASRSKRRQNNSYLCINLVIKCQKLSSVESIE